MASRGLLACSVPIEPSWPVFIACSRSNASGPRTSPTMMRSGRMRRQFLTRSRMVISPSPSRLGGRVSSRTTCGCCSCSSAESSQVMMRSSLSIEPVRQLSSVVLPEPVPPEISTLQRTRPMISSSVLASAEIDLYLSELLELQPVLLELADGERRPVDRQRRRDDVDAAAVGQARVADRARLVDAAADLADDALADVHQLRVVGEAHRRLLHLAGDLDVGRVGAVDHDVGDVVARQQRLERAVAQHVVADVLEQLLLLGDRHHHVLDLDDLADDVADLLARRRRLELGELREVDGVDQRVEDRGLDVVVLLRVPPLRRRPAPAWPARAPRPAPALASAVFATGRRRRLLRGQRPAAGREDRWLRLPNMGLQLLSA